MAEEIIETEEPKVAPVIDANAGQAQAQPAVAPVADDMDDETFLKIMRKKSGNKDLTLEDLKPKPATKTKEEKEKEEQDEEQKAYAWAYSTGKLKKEQYDEAITAKTKSAREVALSNYKAEVKAENPKLDDEEIEEMFKDEYFEGDEDDSPRRKRALARMTKEHQQYLDKYKEVESIPESYRTANKEAEREKGYRKTIKTAVAELPKEITVEIDEDGEKMSYSLPVEDDDRDALVKQFDHPSYYYSLGANEKDVDPKVLNKELADKLEARFYKKSATKIAKLHAETMVKKFELALKGALNTGKALHNIPTLEKPAGAKSLAELAKEKERSEYLNIKL